MIYDAQNILRRFTDWMNEAATDARILEPTAMALATVDAKGRPHARVVLLKEWDERGFVFYSNRESDKGRELSEHPYAALCLHWQALGRQIRIEGITQLVTEEEADSYFASRPRESQLGAWASNQSRPLASREALLERFHEAEARFQGQPIPRPPYWSGWRVAPERIEFWRHGEHRLHDREVFVRQADGQWKMERLYP